mgnify:CR=1 FL=1
MSSLRVKGGVKLSGEITPQGAKNEALQVICATLLSDSDIIISNSAQTIDQRGLADVGTSDDRNDGTRHGAGLRSIHDPTDPRKRKPFETRPIRPK